MCFLWHFQIDFSFFENKETAVSLTADNVPKENLDGIKDRYFIFYVESNTVSFESYFSLAQLEWHFCWTFSYHTFLPIVFFIEF